MGFKGRAFEKKKRPKMSSMIELQWAAIWFLRNDARPDLRCKSRLQLEDVLGIMPAGHNCDIKMCGNGL